MNKYLVKFAQFEKTALRRIVEEIAKGTVKMPTFALAARGFIKTPTQYAKGMKRGNEALSKAYSTPISTTRAKNMSDIQNHSGGFLTFPHTTGPKIHQGGGVKDFITQEIPKGQSFSKQHENMRSSLALRHELHEAREFREATGPIVKTFKGQDQAAVSVLGPGKMPVSKSDKAAVRIVNSTVNVKTPHSFGGHNSLRVLGRESEDVRKNPYLKNSLLARIRKNEGEADAVKDVTGKVYGRDKITGKDLGKLHKLKSPSAT